MIAAKPNQIDAYIAGCPEGARRPLKQVRSTIRRAAPDAERLIEEIVKFRVNEAKARIQAKRKG